MTPGNQPSNVNRMLISKVDPTPCFINTAKGGKSKFKIIVSKDMFGILISCSNLS